MLSLGSWAYLELKSEARRGWNLVPVVIAGEAVEASSTLTIERLSQRSVPEQFITGANIRPNQTDAIINRKPVHNLVAGQPLLWSAFDDDVMSPACLTFQQEETHRVAGATPATDQFLAAALKRSEAEARR